MKSYEDRLPLIDAAIDELKGVFPPTAIGYSGRGYYAKGDFANILHGVNIGDICTRDEFEQRAKELGWVNGYKWGVEYETNGKKPDLPDDVTVSYRAGMWLGVTDVETANWERATSFSIADSRYKPKGDFVNKSGGTLANKEQEMNNDWHGKGELPPPRVWWRLITVEACGMKQR